MIIEKNIDEIYPDPNQPRKTFHKPYLDGLAGSIKTEGLINPIEIDSTGKIITGEQRWRACKLAGLTKVRCQVNDKEYDEYDRLRHQLAENEHQSGGGESMDPIDRAKAYKRLLELKGIELPKYDKRWVRVGGQHANVKTGIQGFLSSPISTAIRELVEEVHVSRNTIDELLSLLYQPQEIQDDIKKNRTGYTLYAEADRVADPGVRKALKNKILQGEFKNKEQVRRILRKAKESVNEAKLELQRNMRIESQAANHIYNGVSKLNLALQNYPLDSLSKAESKVVIDRLLNLQEKITLYTSKKLHAIEA